MPAVVWCVLVILACAAVFVCGYALGHSDGRLAEREADNVARLDRMLDRAEPRDVA